MITTLCIALAVVFGIILLTVLILFCMAFLIKKAVFGSRCDKNPLLKYFSAVDFGLNCRILELKEFKKGSFLRGALYFKGKEEDAKKELIIFCHGMGAGHVAYTTEIAYFCNLGYAVLAPDYMGCNLSDGKSIKNFGNGTKTIIAAAEYARAELKEFDKIYLVGHSRGGYSALTAAALAKADKVVAISAPDKPSKAVYNGVYARSHFLAKILYPFLAVVCGGDSAISCANRLKVPALLVHGENDATVPPSDAAIYGTFGENIKKIFVEGRGHNPYNTREAEQKLAELSSALSGIKSGSVSKDYFASFDFSAATEEDGEVMGEIARFLE